MDIEDYEDIMTVISATFEGCAKACQESDDCIIWEFDSTGAVDGEGQCMLWSIECPGDLMMSGGGWNRHACEMRDPEGNIQIPFFISKVIKSWQALAHPSKVALITVITSS